MIRRTLGFAAFLMAVLSTFADGPARLPWEAGVSRRVITPRTDVWLAGYGMKRPPQGKIHDLWAKTLALRTPEGKTVVLVTTDHMGMSKVVYERLCARVKERFGLERSEFMLTFSHNHCAPCLEGDLVDYYPSDEAQRRLVAEYTRWMESEIERGIKEALERLEPSSLAMGEGRCGFAVNRRENVEAEVPARLAEGKPLKGVVDHAVPVLAVKGAKDELKAVLFGYACHPTTLCIHEWCGDYPGFAQMFLERRYPDATCMFFNACGADANPIPRRSVELAENYGKMLAESVEETLGKPLISISSGLKSAFAFADLGYEKLITRETLIPVANGTAEIQARWAKRMLARFEAGEIFPKTYLYPVEAWQLGRELLLIGAGGEMVVDYALRFKKEFGPGVWVCGYANDMVAYIPSRRVWMEGGYEGGPHLDEYGHPAWRWAGDIEDRISAAVREVVRQVRSP